MHYKCQIKALPRQFEQTHMNYRCGFDLKNFMLCVRACVRAREKEKDKKKKREGDSLTKTECMPV